jgi:prophage regulatory protein
MNTHQDRLLRRRDVEAIIGLSRSAIYARMAEGTFPKPISLSARAVRWRESDICQWMDGLGKPPRGRK